MTDPTPEISVVIPAFNAGPFLADQLGALAAQDWPGAWEVIVADNGSTDDTREVVQAWGDRLPRLRVVDASARPGASHARNAGAEVALGRAVLFVDADDVVAPGWLAAMVTALREADVVAGALVPFGTAVADPGAGTPRASRFSDVLPSAGFLDAAPAGNMGVVREVWREVGGFREEMSACEDTAFSWDVQLAGHRLLRVPEAVVRYRMRPGLRSLARQQYAWGVGAAHVQALFRDRGVPRPSGLGALLRWAALVAMAPLALGDQVSRRTWVGRVARRWGRVVGSVRYRVWCP